MSGRGRPRKNLPIEQAAEFVKHYLKTGSSKEAAIAMGYAPGSAHKTGSRLLRAARVQELLNATKKEIIASGVYDAKQAMAELDSAIEFARQTKNATALARVIELRMKMAGLLVERIDQRSVAGFSINIRGIDDDPTPPPVVDASFAEIFED